ncbi:hypothetical protein GCM10009863_28160 [Streptomyces axinellae]|uniref:Secreted protein n=1 Tax=Streptomyces axinellae TaxID=552788 RepID=A0ABN3Q2A8_9ACTN
MSLSTVLWLFLMLRTDEGRGSPSVFRSSQVCVSADGAGRHMSSDNNCLPEDLMDPLAAPTPAWGGALNRHAPGPPRTEPGRYHVGFWTEPARMI